jgi:hypothetical protein
MQVRALRGVRIAIALLGLTQVCFAFQGQQPAGSNSAPAATVTFKLNFPQSDPQDYSISIDATGAGRYECTGSVAPDSEPDTYRSEFAVSPKTREKIFAWAQQAGYFGGNLDSGNRKLAFTGTKILAYHDGQHDNTARFDYSNSATVRQLTELFQSMAATLEYGRRLAYYHRYQKLALDDELKRMQAEAKNNELSELQSVAPVLQQIIDDNSVLNITRVRAQELLQMGRTSNLAAGHDER